jgi:hypothetical protein
MHSWLVLKIIVYEEKKTSGISSKKIDTSAVELETSEAF